MRGRFTRAAEEPIRLATEIALLLEIVRGDVSRASRFTVSDLGAAAALARGAAIASLLTARVNVALLREEADMVLIATDLAARIDALATLIDDRCEEIIRQTTARIDPTTFVKRSYSYDVRTA